MTTSSLRYFSLGNKWWSWKDRVSMQILTASKYRCQRRSLKEAITTAFQKYFSLETGDGPERTEFWTFWNEAMRYIESCHISSRDASLQFPSATSGDTGKLWQDSKNCHPCQRSFSEEQWEKRHVSSQGPGAGAGRWLFDGHCLLSEAVCKWAAWRHHQCCN